MAIPFPVRDFNLHLIVFGKFKHSKHFLQQFNDDSMEARHCLKDFFRVLSTLRVVIHDGKPIKKCASLLSYPGAMCVRFALVIVAC